ncbi:hypothetical protein GQ53DRAFT_735037 [Thozetella sp. PMI_491]|nr:hypothetical protein GQ53DRAFT_735037 [Thozetella sp. PMI_491]
MTASADSRPIPRGVGAPEVQYALDGLAGPQRNFKKHKVLPHPRKDTYGGAGLNGTKQSVPRKYALDIDTALLRETASQPPLSPSHGQQARRMSSGPDLPPTPPAHSRTSSSSDSVIPSSPTYVATPAQSTENVEAVEPHPAPTTPTNQQTPPTPNLTPERTPPGPAAIRPKPRPLLNDRIPSKATADSRTESFRTAPENPYSSEDDDDGRSTLRPIVPSAKTSQSTVRQVNGTKPQAVGLGLGLESTQDDNLTPRTKGEFITFDGEWGTSNSEVEQEWDANLERHVTVRKRRKSAQTNGHQPEVVEDLTVTPTNATKALRSLSLQESPLVYPRRVVSDRPSTQRVASNSDSSNSMDHRRTSVMSTRSTASTVVEAILVETAPQRRKTLRHVRKQMGLRDSGSDMSPASSTTASLSRDDAQRRRRRMAETSRETRVSTSTFNSISSRKARREVVKNGGIPVVVIPDRSSSNKSTREPSLRSTSSRRSKRSHSLSSVPLSSTSKGKESGPVFERAGRRSRTLSESDGSRRGDQRTIDFPPMIPTRSSSLSAPTSRNASRSGSLTADSLKAHNALQAQHAHQALQKAHQDLQHLTQRERSVESSRTRDGHEVHGDRLFVDHHGDPSAGKWLSVRNTPFSQASVETNNTSHAEVSEAMAVNIYPHQNTSVLMVNHSSPHSSKPSESSSIDQKQRLETETPVIKMTTANEYGPVTPPQAFSMDDVDSPLRNPRAPPAIPEPPVIQFIPATPSGLTPAAEKDKQLGNYYEVAEDKPKRSLSLLRRTLARRRNSEYAPSASRTPGLLTRTFSLTRKRRRETADNTAQNGRALALTKYPSADDGPADENKLHPFWRPTSFDQDLDDEDWDDHDRTYRYPPVDNRPILPRRSLSARFKRTFAILPIEDEYDDYPAPEPQGPDRRTIRRTPSGNLRVMKHRRSLDSIQQEPPPDTRPYTAPDQGANHRPRFFFRTPSLSRVGSKTKADGEPKAAFLPGFGSKFNIPRRLSEHRRQKRSDELRQIISGPREVRDGVGDVIRRSSYRETFTQTQPIEADNNYDSRPI